MKTKLFLLVFMCFGLTSFSQIKFENGYFIDNNGVKTECLIQNSDWLNNPKEFIYKASQESSQEIKTIDNVKEFGVYNVSKFISREVKIDRSSETIKNLTNQKEPVFVKEKLFLKVIVESKATLFSYRDGELLKFFYQLDGSEIQQLIYKKYIDNEGNGLIYNNNQYLIQLWNTFKCPSITMKEVENVKYEKSSLISFFDRYNTCHNSQSVVITKKNKYDWFNLTIKGGINFNSFSAVFDRPGSLADPLDYEFNDKVSFRIGIETEFVLPFNRNKWSIVLDPNFQMFKSETNDVQVSTIDYKSIEFTFGVRHYFFLNNSSKLFINAFGVSDLSIKTDINLFNFSTLESTSNMNLGLGIGYKFKNKISIEYRYNTSRSLTYDYNSLKSDFNNQALIFGYTLF